MNIGTVVKMKQCHCYYFLLFLMLMFLTRLKNFSLEVRVGNNGHWVVESELLFMCFPEYSSRGVVIKVVIEPNLYNVC